jgi:hypothetical protein
MLYAAGQRGSGYPPSRATKAPLQSPIRRQ